MLTDFHSDPDTISMIKKEISSIERPFSFLGSHVSEVADDLAHAVDQVRIKLMEGILPESPDQAIELLLRLLDIHENALGEVDDSDGVLGDAFKQACADLGKAFESSTNSLDNVVELVYDRFMKNEYGIYDCIISDFKDVLGNSGLNLLKQKLESSNVQEDPITIELGLKSIADCQNDVDAYIKACSFIKKPCAYAHIEIAERLMKHSRNKEAIQWLDSMDLPTTHQWQQDKQALKIKALDLCGDHKEAQAERLNWFDSTLSLKVYNEVLQHGDTDFIDSFKKTSIQKALDYPNLHKALVFLKGINEFKLARSIQLKINALA